MSPLKSKKYIAHTCNLRPSGQKQDILLNRLEYAIVINTEQAITHFFDRQRDIDASNAIRIEWKWINYHIRGLWIEFEPQWSCYPILDHEIFDTQLWQHVFCLLGRLPAFFEFSIRNLPLEQIDITDFLFLMVPLTRLKSFMFECAAIKEIPPNILNFKWLESINFCFCDLEEFPAWITDLPHLKRINLENNNISTIPPLSRKIALYIAHNKIAEINFPTTTPIQSYSQFADNPLKSLHGMTEKMYQDLRRYYIEKNEESQLFEISPEDCFKLREEGLALLKDYITDERKLPPLKNYFRKSRQEIKQELLTTGTLPKCDQERLCHEMSDIEKHELKSILRANHPILDQLFPRPQAQIPTDDLLYTQKERKKF